MGFERGDDLFGGDAIGFAPGRAGRENLLSERNQRIEAGSPFAIGESLQTRCYFRVIGCFLGGEDAVERDGGLKLVVLGGIAAGEDASHITERGLELLVLNSQLGRQQPVGRGRSALILAQEYVDRLVSHGKFTRT